MTKEELEKYAHENRKRLDAQEVKIGDVVKVLRGQFAGETGVIVGIIVCGRDYADPYYEVDMDCEVPDKYKCRKNTLAPNNVIGGLSAYEFEVIGNRAPMQSTEEIKVGDKVRIANDAPAEYRYGFNYRLRSQVSEVIGLDDEGFMAAILPLCVNDKDLWFQIPTKYLIKVDAEAKEPKFKVGDVIDTPKGKGTVRISYDGYWVVQLDNGVWYIHTETNMPSAPYTKPKEQTEAEETDTDNLKKIAEEWANNVSNAIEEYGDAMCKIYVETHNEAYWDAYTADLAKEIALKVANKYSDPKEAAGYAVSVAKAVVENLKKK